MSLDSLFQHIVRTEQQAKERRRLLQEVKSEVQHCNEQNRDVTAKIEEAKTALEEKIRLLAEKQCDRDLLKNRLDILQSQKESLVKEKETFHITLETLKKDAVEEEEKFLQEVMKFNSNYGLTSNRDQILQEQVKVEMEQLELEELTLRNEMESLERENFHLKNLQRQKKSMKEDITRLQVFMKDIEDKITAAINTTKNLEKEKLLVTQKPQSDADCLR
ncbi:hypothetical protein GDO86_013699 [Hymenochirus boettgeri]|uniref:Coiled-coil domain-containing protein 172 n=1 Tax=Hymenochirus boettgeri TaxID=247094 RepID=A0A8T2ISD7_9PIPI|nr:hypothetical protein GDO86_013699 [Hymenochirus boettgeri]